MVAVYPSAIKNFAYRQDFTDLVEAADVNVSYDEIRATQSTLGVNPNQETIDGTLKKYSTVSSRIAAVRKGVENPYVAVRASNIHVNYKTDLIPNWTSKISDSHGMWDGSEYLTCKRTGVYHFDFYIRWHKDNVNNVALLPEFDRSGKIQIEGQFTSSSSFLTCQTNWFPQGFQDFARQSCSITFPWTAGNKLYLRAYQGVYHAGFLTATVFTTVAYLRDLP